MSAARGFSPTARRRRPQRVRNRKKASAGTSRSPSHVIRLASPIAWPKNPTCWISGILMLGTWEMLLRGAVGPVVGGEEIARDPEGEEVDAGSADHLVGAQVDREEGVHERQQAPATAATTSPEHPGPEHVGAPDPEVAPISIMPSRPMLITPLRSETMPPSAANSSGRGVAEHRPRRAPTTEHRAQVANSGRWSFPSAPAMAEQRQRRDAPKPSRRSPAKARSPRPASRRCPSNDRRDRSADEERRQRDRPMRARRGRRRRCRSCLAEASPGRRSGDRPDAHAARLLGAPLGLARRLKPTAIPRPPRSTRSAITSVETSSTISPWIM